MNIEDSSMPLQNANWVVRKRNVRLCDLISSDRIDWLAILTDGYIYSSGRQLEVRSFDELEGLQKQFDLPSLSDIRAQGLLIEGERALPRGLINCLAECSDGDVRVRSSGTNAIETKDIHSFNVVMSEGVSDDEMEAATTNGAWYLRMRNDDALIFIAASHVIAQKIISTCPANVRHVPSEFIFSP